MQKSFLTVLAVGCLAATPLSADAATVTHRDPVGDNTRVGGDIIRTTVTNGRRISVTVKYRKLRSTDMHMVYFQHTRDSYRSYQLFVYRRTDGRLHAELNYFTRAGGVSTPCPVTAATRFGTDTFIASFPSRCIRKFSKTPLYYQAISLPHAVESDHTPWLKVRRF